MDRWLGRFSFVSFLFGCGSLMKRDQRKWLGEDAVSWFRIPPFLRTGRRSLRNKLFWWWGNLICMEGQLKRRYRPSRSIKLNFTWNFNRIRTRGILWWILKVENSQWLRAFWFKVNTTKMAVYCVMPSGQLPLKDENATLPGGDLATLIKSSRRLPCKGS